MNVTVEELSPVSKKLTVEVPADDVARALDEQFKKLGKVVAVRGFRAGKVPKEMVRKLYAQDAQQEVARAMVQKHFQGALDQAGVKPLTMPEISNDPFKTGEPLRLHFTCDVMPTFDAADIDDLTLTTERVEPTDAELDARIQELRERHGEAETVEGRGADTGDIVDLRFSVRVAGDETAFTGPEPITANPTLGQDWRYPMLSDALMGKAAGDKVTHAHTMPADWSEEALAGKDVVFEAEVVALSRRVLPDVDDAFAKDNGHDDLGAMRAAIYDEIAKRLKTTEAERCERAVTDAIIAKNDIAVPLPLLRAHVDEAVQHIAGNFKRMGLNDELIQQLIDREAERIVANSKRAVQRDMVLDKLADTLEIALTDADVETSLNELADKLRMPLAKIKGQLEKAGGIEDYRRRMRRERAMNALVERAKAKAA